MVVGVMALGAVGLSATAPASERWGSFRGQVVDVETGQPIAGAVALAIWWEVVPSLVHGTQKFYDAREALTGPDGRFEIPRLSVPPWQLGVQPQRSISLPRATLLTPISSHLRMGNYSPIPPLARCGG